MFCLAMGRLPNEFSVKLVHLLEGYAPSHQIPGLLAFGKSPLGHAYSNASVLDAAWIPISPT